MTEEIKGTYYLKCGCGNEVPFPLAELPTKKKCECGMLWECEPNFNVRCSGDKWYSKTERYLYLYQDMETIIKNRATELNDILEVKYPSASQRLSHGGRGYSELTEPESFANIRIEDKDIQSLKKEILDLKRAKDTINDILPSLSSKDQKLFKLIYRKKSAKLYIWTTLEIPERTFYREKKKLVERFAIAIGTLKEKNELVG